MKNSKRLCFFPCSETLLWTRPQFWAEILILTLLRPMSSPYLVQSSYCFWLIFLRAGALMQFRFWVKTWNLTVEITHPAGLCWTHHQALALHQHPVEAVGRWDTCGDEDQLEFRCFAPTAVNVVEGESAVAPLTPRTTDLPVNWFSTVNKCFE